MESLTDEPLVGETSGKAEVLGISLYTHTFKHKEPENGKREKRNRST